MSQTISLFTPLLSTLIGRKIEDLQCFWEDSFLAFLEDPWHSLVPSKSTKQAWTHLTFVSGEIIDVQGGMMVYQTYGGFH